MNSPSGGTTATSTTKAGMIRLVGLRSRSLSPSFYPSSTIPEAWLTPERLPVSMRQGQGFLD